MSFFQNLAGVIGASPKPQEVVASSAAPVAAPVIALAPAPTPAQQGFLGKLGHLGLHVMAGSQVKDGPGDVSQAQLGQMAQPNSGHFSPAPPMTPAYHPINFQQPQVAQAYHPMQFQALANAAIGR